MGRTPEEHERHQLEPVLEIVLLRGSTQEESTMHHNDVQASTPPVIVTGSSGLIGAAVVKALAPHYRVIGFDRPGLPEPPPQADSVGVDLTRPESLRHGLEHVRAVYGAQIASVIHLAAYYDFSGGAE